MSELKRMAAICRHVKRSEATVLHWINVFHFPAKKEPGSDTFSATVADIEAWRRGPEAIKAGFVIAPAALHDRDFRPQAGPGPW